MSKFRKQEYETKLRLQLSEAEKQNAYMKAQEKLADDSRRHAQAVSTNLVNENRALRAQVDAAHGDVAHARNQMLLVQQRVTQLEGERAAVWLHFTLCNSPQDLLDDLGQLLLDHHTLLGLVQAYQQAVRDTQSVPATRDAYNRREESLAKAQEALYCYPSTPPLTPTGLAKLDTSKSADSTATKILEEISARNGVLYYDREEIERIIIEAIRDALPAQLAEGVDGINNPAALTPQGKGVRE